MRKWCSIAPFFAFILDFDVTDVVELLKMVKGSFDMGNTNAAEQSVREFLSGISENKNIYFTGTTLKNPIEYKVDDTIVFKIRPECDGEGITVPYVSYYLEGDDGEKNEGFVQANNDGWYYIETSLKRDGFVHLIAKACDENKEAIEEIEIYEGGAGADIEKIRCETEIPEDYFQFWDKLKKEAEAVPEEILYHKEIAADKGYKSFDMHLKTPTADFISINYSYPENAKDGSLKLLIICMGYGVASADPVFRDGYLVVRINTHDILNGQPPEYYENLREGKCFRYGMSAAENQKPETSFWKKLYIRDFQVLNFFKKHSLVNGMGVEFEGGSQAAFQACNLAVHSGVATIVRLNVAWFCDMYAFEKEKRLKHIFRPENALGHRYFDTAVAAKYLKCPVYIEAGLGDYICPPSGQMAMYNGITAPKKIRFIQNKTHSYTPPVISSVELSEGYSESEWSFV